MDQESTALTAESVPRLSQHSYTVKPAKAWPKLQLAELWNYRSLVYFLAWRDIKLQFKQTILGAAWAVIQPLSMALIFSLVFGYLFNMQTNDIPYLLFFYSGLVPFTLFTTCLNACANSIVGDSNLIQKVYFPRLIMPFAALLPPIFDFFFAFLVLIVMSFCFGFFPGVQIVFLPFFVLLALISALGVGLWFCALNVRYRDARYLLPLTLTMWLYVTPVFYPSSMIPEKVRWLFSLNPIVGVVEGVRWSLFGSAAVPFEILIVSTLASTVVLITGAFYFRRCEETFADEL
jgi:lipopolysaccharide transport system permease protein